MKYTIRKIRKDETDVLKDFLYEAIFLPEGVDPPERDIINLSDLKIYIEDFGEKEDDLCLVAEVEGKIVGAAWTRIMNDYGHIDKDTPSLAISLYKDYRNRGIGTALMKRLLEALSKEGYKRVSLSVQKDNYAVNMYRAVGFKTVEEKEEEYIMVCGIK